MPECDLCGEERGTETLGFDRRNRVFIEDFWRVARVCDDCRKNRLMPALRELFGDGALNLAPAAESPWRTAELPGGALFWSFETAGGTTHAAREAERHVSSPRTWRVTAHCGIEAAVEPEPRSRPLSEQREGIVTCDRCRYARPRHFS